MRIIFLDVDGVLNNEKYSTFIYKILGRKRYIKKINKDFDIFDLRSVRYIAKLIDYFDVWGNETDGYEVNDKIDTNIMLEIPYDVTDEELISKLVNVGFLGNNAAVENVRIEWSDETFCELFEMETDLPLCCLVLE